MVTSPALTLKTVCRREEDLVAAAGCCCCWGSSGCEEGEGRAGGGTEKRARSWVSVSRMREVMSWFERRALVKILGGGKLGFVNFLIGSTIRMGRARTVDCQFLDRRWRFAPDALRGASWWVCLLARVSPVQPSVKRCVLSKRYMID